MNIVVPMAGSGRRFQEAGIMTPKPLIKVIGDEPMIAFALHSLNGLSLEGLIFVILKEHAQRFGLATWLYTRFPDALILQLDAPTNGQLETVMKAAEWIDCHERLMVANCDTFMSAPLAQAIRFLPRSSAGLIVAYDVSEAPGESYSFVRTDDTKRIALEVAEKRRISNYATTGHYFFEDGHRFCRDAERLIASGERVNGEAYVAPIYQDMIRRGNRIDVLLADQMWDMGTPDDLAMFQAYLESKPDETAAQRGE